MTFLRLLFFETRYSKLLRYIMSGGISYIVYSGLVLLSHGFALSRTMETLWTGFAYFLASVVNYFLHYYFTYQSTTNHMETFFKFWAVVIIGVLALAALVWTLSDLVSEGLLLAVKLSYAFVWPLVSMVLLSMFVFKKRT